jgi:hypothetical protein
MLLIIPGLDPEEPGVFAVLCNELLMGAPFSYAARFHEIDDVGGADCG